MNCRPQIKRPRGRQRTDRSLAELLEQRLQSWKRFGNSRTMGELREQWPEDHKTTELLSCTFRESGRLIVQELHRRGTPVRITTVHGEPVELRLTCDAMSFVVLEPGTLKPAWKVDGGATVHRSILFDYAAACPN